MCHEVRMCCARPLLLVLAIASLALSEARADQVTMKNGDRVTGSVIKQDGKSITIKTVNFGEVTAPWEQVAAVQTEQPVTVVLTDGKAVEGTLSTSEGKVEIAAPGGRVDVNPADVTAMRNADEQKEYERRLSPGFLQLWAGTGSLGLAGANGNAKTLTFTTAVNAARVTNTDKTSIYFNVIKASAVIDRVSASTAEAVRGGVAYDHNITQRLFVHLFNDYEYDKFQNLDLRYVFGAGLGFHVLKTERSTLDLLGGGDYNHSSFSTGLNRHSGEAFWGDDYVYKLTRASALTQSFRMFNNLSDTGEFRMNFDLGVVSKLRPWLSWNVALSDRYLSNPVPGRKTNDWLYTTGVGVTFGH